MPFKRFETPLNDAYVVEPRCFEDERGFFMESFNQREFDRLIGKTQFVQDNHSLSSKGVVRGLHFQIRKPQGKLIRVLRGEIYDVIVDLRSASTTFGQWFGVELSSENRRQLWVPPGFAHGFMVISEQAEIAYKTTDYWYPEYERCLRWNDETVGITWPQSHSIVLSDKDSAGLNWEQISQE